MSEKHASDKDLIEVAVAEVRREAESQGLVVVKRGHAWGFRNRRAERAEAEVKLLKEAWRVYVKNTEGSLTCPEHGEEQVYGPCRSCFDLMNKAFEGGKEAVD